jgi:soluble lytic murein transglycosylase-like protein/tetratricopeptide (TPR) repeat protein
MFHEHMRLRFRAAVAVAATALALPLWAAFDGLVLSGDWEKVLEVASRRAGQLPLSQRDAMIAAHAAQQLGDRESEERFLTSAVEGGNPDFSELAGVQLAALVQNDDPNRAVELSVPTFGRGRPWALREAATEASIGALLVGVDPQRRAFLENGIPKLTRSLRRRLELALAISDDQQGRRRLDRLLSSSTRDLVALQAAETLWDFDDLTVLERWRVAKTLYRHALYDRAAPIFEQLDEVQDGSLPRDDVAFLRGRCAFRRGRWSEAIAWYRKALARVRSNEGRAEIEVHIGRCFELEGDLDEAVQSAIRAVRTRTTDERRLFLARLRLRRFEPDLAAKGISHLRDRTYRAQGEVMLAVDALQRGDVDGARKRLERVRRQPWVEPAAVLAAGLAVKAGEFEAALAILKRVSGSGDGFWVAEARGVMSSLPTDVVEAWRKTVAVEAATSEGRTRWRALGRWAVLEPDPKILGDLRTKLHVEFGDVDDPDHPVFDSGLAADLWSAGLRSQAARWDPSGFPRNTPLASAWSAARFLEYGFPWRATRVADGAWRQAGSEVPAIALPDIVRRALYALPGPGLVRSSAAFGQVDWELLAAVAREESRWDARALSAVGARGLVQLMPATAASVAKRIGRPEPSGEDLFDAGVNLQLGGAELGRLMAVFDGRRAPAIAAYNAGEAQARLWLDQCGPSCTDALYLLNISFRTTRSYTAGVMAAATNYAELYAVDEDDPSGEAGTEVGR